MTDLTPTPFQARVLGLAAHVNLMLAGGRGGGKSHAAILCGLQHIVDFGDIARPLVVRESWQALQELQDKFYTFCILAFGPRVSRNKSEGIISLPNGAIITFTNLSDEESVRRAQGRTYTALIGDEVGTLPPQCFVWLQRLRSNLRVPLGKRAMIVLTANPHGKSHTAIYKRWISKAPAWKPYRDEAGDLWINAPSTLEENPHIDQKAYVRQLKAATHGDTALASAWIHGGWGALGGNLFGNFDPQFHIIAPPPRYLLDASFTVGSDWGTASPATAALIAHLRRGFHHEGRRYLHGDLIVLDEIDTCPDPTDLSKGDGRSPVTFAEDVVALLGRWNIKNADVVVDSARGLEGDTVLGFYQAAGLDAYLPDKRSRVARWDLIRTRLENARESKREGLYISSKCRHLIETLPEAPRSPLRAEEMDPAYHCDHMIDGASYGIDWAVNSAGSGSGRVIGGY